MSEQETLVKIAETIATGFPGLGNPTALKMAIGNYDEAIASLNDLTLETAEYRNGLANAWVNRGNALQTLGSPADLKDAIASYDEAIALGNQLPLDVAEYRNGLARAWMNRGSAQRSVGSRLYVSESLISFENAIELSSELTMVAPAWAATGSRAFLGKTRALPDLAELVNEADESRAYHEQATDCADQGLQICRDWRRLGQFGLRQEMERLLAAG